MNKAALNAKPGKPAQHLFTVPAPLIVSAFAFQTPDHSHSIIGLRSILLKNKAKKYFGEEVYRHAYRQKATTYENIGFFRPIGLMKTSPSIGSGDDRAVLRLLR